ncbi:TraI domain-containing protein [Paraburkholderia rhizosphaerae]|uniref:Conjugal transfer pilus assembly protein TraI n=1 Tax=Paraburkholderia rhizosphaerae TaxID=480658 RepID=A0A4R8LP51_9BURK|nr:TraI domain-containing protein [Paraburkholderia rhizosphaerae]TDY48078.1 conjugal transfer pilus assembly protein TraI [Paraburkholderia rhizosphaerae]
MSIPLHAPASAEDLLALHGKRIDLIRQCANEANGNDFERKWLSVLRRCAGWFSSMPLSSDLYREPGGAFRCAVETAFYAMRLAGGQKFGTNLPSEKRRRIEPQYNYGVFLAAVCSRLDEPYRHFVIERHGDGAHWNPSVQGAAGPWLSDKPYRVERRAAVLPVERMRTGMLAQMLIGSDLLAGLDAEVLAEVFGAINPNAKPLEAETLTHKVVRQAIDAAVDFERKAQRTVVAPVAAAVPPAEQLAAAASPAPPAGSASSAAPQSCGAQASPKTGAGAPTAQGEAPAHEANTAKAPASPPSTSSDDGRAAAPRSLLEAIGIVDAPATAIEPAAKRASAADQLGLPFAPGESGAAAINPADMRAPQTGVSPDTSTAFDDVLKGAPNMILDLFRALREDVAGGKAKVQWTDKGLVIQKRLIGNYGIASDTLVDHLRKRSLLLSNGQGEITLAPRAGDLILPRTETT